MNESNIESLLQSLKPSGPSAALTQRVEHELELDMQWLATPPRRKSPRWMAPLGWISVGAAAALAILGMVPHSATSSSGTVVPLASIQPGPISPNVMPVHTIREVVSAQDQGIQYNDESHLPEQHVKFVSVERHAWIDPRDGAEITVEVPREESVVLPVSFQ